MTLGEFVRQYRETHGLSLRAFSSLVGISTQQISNIERGIGNDGKPMTSTMKTYKKIAEAIGMTENDFLNMLSDDVRVNPVYISSVSGLSDDEADLLEIYRELNSEGQRKVYDYILDLIRAEVYLKKDSAISVS